MIYKNICLTFLMIELIKSKLQKKNKTKKSEDLFYFFYIILY